MKAEPINGREYKFVKIEGFDMWFLYFSPEDEDFDQDMYDVFQMNMEGLIKDEYAVNKNIRLYMTRMEVLNRYGFIKYKEVANKYKEVILIREVGSYMHLHDNYVIIEEVISDSFPI